MNILAIESSCDETAAAVVRDGRTVLSNCVASQIEMHTIYGGVVPEIASRKHVEAVSGLAREALERDYRKVGLFARREGLTAHARAVEIRFEGEEGAQ